MSRLPLVAALGIAAAAAAASVPLLAQGSSSAASAPPACSADTLPEADKAAMEQEYARRSREDGQAAAWGPRWSLIYVRTAPCDTTCVEDLARIAAVHIRLGRDQPRMRRIYIGPEPEPLAALDPMLAALPIGTPSYQAFADALVSAGVPPAEGGRLYVVDPHGNLVLSYPPRPDQEGLLKDLERLLDASRIG